MNRIGIIVALMVLLVVVENPGNAQNAGKKAKARVAVSAASSIESQLKSENSVIEIQDNFNLAGRAVKIPANSTLRFIGGGFSNGTVDFNGCRIEGDPVLNCSLKGDVANDYVDLRWFGIKENDPAFDNGPIINKVCAAFDNILLPKGIYYFSTPIVVPNVRHLEFNGDLVYRGGKNTTAITLSGTTAVINFNGVVSNSNNKNVSFSNYGKNSNMVGVSFVNLNNSRVYLNEVKYFNENVRVAGLGAGSCYNTFSFGLIRNANVGLRIYQDNANNNIGWANENMFIGGRFCNFSDWNKSNESHAVVIAGPESSSDKYDSANALHFAKQSFEGYDTIVYARNVGSSDFLYSRVEGSKTFVKFVGNCKNCRISTGYNDNCKLYDASENKMIPIRMEEESQFHIATIDLRDGVSAVSNNKGAKGYSSEHFAFASYSSQKFEMQTVASVDYSASIPKTTSNAPAVYVDTKSTKLFKVKASSPCRVMVAYVQDNSGSQITWNSISSYSAPQSSIKEGVFYFNTGSHVYVTGADCDEIIFSVPEKVSRIQLRVSGSFETATVMSYREPAPVSFPVALKNGPSSSRPSYGYPGQMYFDTGLSRYITWNGSKWVNFDGSSL